MGVLAERRGSARVSLCAAVCVVAGALHPVAGQEISSGIDPNIKQEIEYAQALNTMGLPDYAEIVIQRVDLTRHPEAKALLKVIELQGLIARGQFDRVRAIIGRERDQDSQEGWAMKLALADGYYAWGRYPEAQGIYESIFAKYPDGPPEGLNAFYLESAYKYAQMLLLMGSKKRALKAYRNVVKAKLEKHIERQVLGETAELLVHLAEETEDKAKRKRYFEEIDKINNVILWVQDLWFGKAIVIMAHVKVLEGDVDGATKLIVDYAQQLEQIDQILKDQERELKEPLTKLSPMAECRYLIGRIRHDEAKKILADEAGDKKRALNLLVGDKGPSGKRKKNGALHEFTRVFVNYPNTKWAAAAGRRAKKITELLERDFGAKVQTNITEEKMAKIRQIQFQSAKTMFNQQQFTKAAETYLDVLAIFPEGEESLVALEDLAKCYVELQNELLAELVIRHLSERFCENDDMMSRAGDGVLRIAYMYDEKRMNDRRDQTYSTFFRQFIRHPRTPALLFRFGEDRLREEDYAGAMNYYRRVRTNYSGSTMFLDAVSKLAHCHSALGSVSNEIEILRDVYIPKLEKKDRPGHALISAKYRLACAHRKQGNVNDAYRGYRGLIALLDKGNDEYHNTPQEKEANRDVLEASLYFKAIGFPKMEPPAGKTEEFLRLLAIQALEKLVAEHPKSQFSPAALSQIGALYTILEKPDEAEKTLQQLQKDYPQSPEAKNSLFMLGKSLLDLGMRKRAVKVFKQMFVEGGKYTSSQILTAGRELLKAGEEEIALEAFDHVLNAETKAGLVQPAMVGKGEALLLMKRWEEAVKVLDAFVTKYPRSGYLITASLHLSRAYSGMAGKIAEERERVTTFNRAVDAMNRARRYERTAGGRARLNLAVARINLRKALAEEKFGGAEFADEYKRDAIAAYQLLMGGRSSEAEVRPHIETAYVECIPLLMELKEYQDAIDDSDEYLQLFSGGANVLAIRKFRDQARIKKLTQRAVPPVPGAETGQNKNGGAGGG